MSLAEGLIYRANSKVQQLQYYWRLTKSFFRRNNPASDMYTNFIITVKNILTANKKLKIAKYRVNHLRYRLNQMENLIAENNPYSTSSGKKIDLMR